MAQAGADLSPRRSGFDLSKFDLFMVDKVVL